MRNLVVLAFAGFVAQLIDGALGMGYGVTSTSMLLTLGLAPAIVSASVHVGEVFTTLASGIAHWRFGNVDKDMMWCLGLPGAAGGFFGALFLASMPVNIARPAVSVFLLLLGLFVLVRFVRPNLPSTVQKPPGRRLLLPLGLIAGFLDASGGGGWGPVSTSTLIASRNSDARKVIGSVDASEFLVALAASVGFIFALGWAGINLTWVAAIMIGGVCAAPLAAWAVRKLPTQVLGIAVGAMILLTNSRTILQAFKVEVPIALFLALCVLPAILAYFTARLRENQKADSPSR